MKLGQMVSFIADGLPARGAGRARSRCSRTCRPMAPSLAEQVVRERARRRPRARSSSTGTRCRWRRRRSARCTGRSLRDGRVVAVKVQYPGVGTRHQRTTSTTPRCSTACSRPSSLKGLDVHGLVDELRARMGDELDYRLEAALPDRVRRPLPRPPVHPHPRASSPSCRRERVLTTRLGRRHQLDRLRGHRRPRPSASTRPRSCSASPRARCTAHRRLQRRPAPGQLPLPPRRHGHVPRLRAGEALARPTSASRLIPILDHVLAHDVAGHRGGHGARRLPPPDHGLDPQRVYDCVSAAVPRLPRPTSSRSRQSYTTEALRNAASTCRARTPT